MSCFSFSSFLQMFYFLFHFIIITVFSQWHVKKHHILIVSCPDCFFLCFGKRVWCNSNSCIFHPESPDFRDCLKGSKQAVKRRLHFPITCCRGSWKVRIRSDADTDSDKNAEICNYHQHIDKCKEYLTYTGYRKV